MAVLSEGTLLVTFKMRDYTRNSSIKQSRLDNTHYTKDETDHHLIFRKLQASAIISFLFFIMEVAGGVYSHSLAVLSVAVHLFANLSSFSVTILCATTSRLPPNFIYTLGQKRIEALAALFSMSSLMIVSFFLAGEAVRRVWLMYYTMYSNEILIEPVDGGVMSVTMALCVVANLSLAAIVGDHFGTANPIPDDSSQSSHSNVSDCDLSDSSEGSESYLSYSYSTEESSLIDQRDHDRTDNNYKGIESHRNYKTRRRKHHPYLYTAYIQLLSDLVQSIFGFMAGILIWYDSRWKFLDPIYTITFCLLAVNFACGVISKSAQVLMNTAPPDIDWLEIYNAFNSVRGVSNIHNLHIWEVDEDITALSVHADADDIEEALHSFHGICKRFKIRHSTIKLHPCNSEAHFTCHYVL